MLLRFCEILWVVVHAILGMGLIIIPTSELGLIGFFIGLGVIVSFILMYAFITATFNYLFHGVFTVDDDQIKRNCNG